MRESGPTPTLIVIQHLRVRVHGAALRLRLTDRISHLALPSGTATPDADERRTLLITPPAALHPNKTTRADLLGGCGLLAPLREPRHFWMLPESRIRVPRRAESGQVEEVTEKGGIVGGHHRLSVHGFATVRIVDPFGRDRVECR